MLRERDEANVAKDAAINKMARRCGEYLGTTNSSTLRARGLERLERCFGP